MSIWRWSGRFGEVAGDGEVDFFAGVVGGAEEVGGGGGEDAGGGAEMFGGDEDEGVVALGAEAGAAARCVVVAVDTQWRWCS